MRALAVQSANDMAVALAEKMGGTEARFAALMTLRGQELGMHNTRFVNASGLPDSRQISTAKEFNSVFESFRIFHRTAHGELLHQKV